MRWNWPSGALGSASVTVLLAAPPMGWPWTKPLLVCQTASTWRTLSTAWTAGAFSTTDMTLRSVLPKLTGSKSRASTSSQRAYCSRRLILPRSR